MTGTVDGFAFFARKPVEGLRWTDDFWAVPITASEAGWRLLQELQTSSWRDKEYLMDRLRHAASPLARPFLQDSPYFHARGVAPAKMTAPDETILNMLKTENRLGQWIEKGLIATQMHLSPFWELAESSDATDHGLRAPKPNPSFQHFLDLGYDSPNVAIADRNTELSVEDIAMDVRDLEEYRLDLFAAPYRDTICLSVWPDTAGLHQKRPVRSLVADALARARLSWVSALLPETLRKHNAIRSPSRKAYNAPDSPWGPEASQTGYYAMTQALLAIDPFPMKGGPYTAVRWKPLRRTYLLPGVYPDGWTSPRERKQSLGRAWAEAVLLAQEFGVEPPESP